MKNSTFVITALCITIVSCVTITSLKDIYIGSSAKQTAAVAGETCACKVILQNPIN